MSATPDPALSGREPGDDPDCTCEPPMPREGHVHLHDDGCPVRLLPLVLWPPPNPTCDRCKPFPGDPCVCGWDG